MKQEFSAVLGTSTKGKMLDPQATYRALMSGQIDFKTVTPAGHMRIAEALSALPDRGMIKAAFYLYSTSLTRSELNTTDALMDGVTSVNGRKKLTAEMEVNMYTALSGGLDVKNPPVFMILDLDGFKTINDTLGHMTGDAVLAEFAKRLCKAFESKQNPLNRVYRMGGDEFAVIVHGMEKEQAVRVAREAIARFVVTGPDEEKLPVSASVGAAYFRSQNPNDTATAAVSNIMAEADEEVYLDKAFKIERLEEVLKATCVTEMFASMQLG